MLDNSDMFERERLPGIILPSLQPDRRGRTTHNDFHYAADSFPTTARLDPTVFVVRKRRCPPR